MMVVKRNPWECVPKEYHNSPSEVRERDSLDQAKGVMRRESELNAAVIIARRVLYPQQDHMHKGGGMKGQFLRSPRSLLVCVCAGHILHAPPSYPRNPHEMYKTRQNKLKDGIKPNERRISIIGTQERAKVKKIGPDPGKTLAEDVGKRGSTKQQDTLLHANGTGMCLIIMAVPWYGPSQLAVFLDPVYLGRCLGWDLGVHACCAGFSMCIHRKP